MRSPASRHLSRLLGYPPQADLTPADLAGGVLARPERVVHGLVDEALASDDVLSAHDARLFVEERIAEWADLLDAGLRQRLAGMASAEIQRRAP